MNKYTLHEVMTISEVVERYGVTIDMIKNRLKPSKVGKEKIDKMVEEGVIRLSGRTWLITDEYMQKYF